MKICSKRLDFQVSKCLGLAIGLFVAVIFLESCQTTSDPSVEKTAQPRQLILDEPEWMIQVERGKKASESKHWHKAAQFFTKALDLMDDSRATPDAPSPSQITEVIRLDSYARMLASNAATTRSLQSCNHSMRSSVRGVQITKHLMPVEFETDKTTFTKKGTWSAQHLAQCLIEKQDAGLYQVILVGHTDERGSADYNDKLSMRRAKALKDYLKKKRVDLHISTKGRGEREPLQRLPDNLSKSEKYQMNRRVEVKMN